MLLADSLDSLEVERENIDVLISRRVDAIVISPLHRTKSRPALVSAAQLLPVIQFDRIAAASLPYVGVDQYGAMTKLLDHLEAGGRSRIAYVGSDTGESTAAERLTAFRDWTAARNLPQGYSLTPSTMEGGTSAARRILARRPDVDAIACCNDVIAIGVLFHLGARGIAVPGEVAVTGFDNTIGSQLCRPTLTTATQPLEEVARQAVAWAQSADPPPERRAVLDATIEIRESTVGRTAAGLNRPGAPE
ncbi:MAG: substrate-binding domain-containing protein, partial [Bifidobacteriaceae bacterium]|jgi:LacI family transcriptional regulator|nr:substrate-binding domain-containing protein [Bifidobacteriaceae bacterium]